MASPRMVSLYVISWLFQGISAHHIKSRRIKRKAGIALPMMRFISFIIIFCFDSNFTPSPIGCSNPQIEALLGPSRI